MCPSQMGFSFTESLTWLMEDMNTRHCHISLPEIGKQKNAPTFSPAVQFLWQDEYTWSRQRIAHNSKWPRFGDLMVFMVWDIYIMTAKVHYNFLVQRWSVSPWGVFWYFSLKHTQPPVSSWLCVTEITKWGILTTFSSLLNKINWFNNLVAGLLFL